MGDDAYSYTVKLKRGDGHDVQKCKVTADSYEVLVERVENVRELLADNADELRDIQPMDGRDLADDQGTLQEASHP